jgi:hypothetical protein
MPFDYYIDTSHRLVATMVKGILTPFELLRHQDRVKDDPEFDPTFWQLHDVRNADFTEVQPSCVEALAELAVPKRGTRRAIVVGTAQAHELAQLFEGLLAGTGEQIRIFRDLDAARTWLELPPESSKGPSTWLSQELRPLPRKQLQITVLCRSGIREGIGQLVNVSLSGALLECSVMSPPPGTIVTIQFLPRQSDAETPVELKGRVLRYTSKGFAIKFLTITKELEQLVESSS